MARLNCTFKWQGKSEHLDEKMQKCTFKWEDKSVRLNGKTNDYF